MEKASDGARVRFPPPLIYLAGLALGIAADRFGHLPRLGLQPAVRDVLGIGLFIAGFAISLAGAGLFMRRGTAIIPYNRRACW